MIVEKIDKLELKGFKYNPELDRYNDVPMFEENLAQVNEMLQIYGVPIIENGKIIGTRFPPDENGKEVVKMKAQPYKLYSEEINFVQDQRIDEKVPTTEKIKKINTVHITGKNGKTKITFTPKPKKAKVKKTEKK